jgi:hypothetical protein
MIPPDQNDKSSEGSLRPGSYINKVFSEFEGNDGVRASKTTAFRSELWIHERLVSLQAATDWLAMAILRLAVVASLFAMVGGSVMGFLTMKDGWEEGWKGRTKVIKTLDQNGTGNEKSVDSIEQVAEPKNLQPNEDNSAAPLNSGNPEDHGKGTIKGLKMAITGLEFLLLAPLSFLILRSLAEYIEDLARDKRRVAEIDHRLVFHPDSVKLKEIEESFRGSAVSPKTKSSLLDAKVLTIGLLFSVLATHLVGDLIVEKEVRTEDLAAFKMKSIIGLVLLVVLGGIFYMLEKVGGHEVGKAKVDPESPDNISQH